MLRSFLAFALAAALVPTSAAAVVPMHPIWSPLTSLLPSDPDMDPDTPPDVPLDTPAPETGSNDAGSAPTPTPDAAEEPPL